MKNLKKRLLIAVCGVCLICLAVTSVMSYLVASRRLTTMAGENATLLTERSAREIDEWIHGYAVYLETVADTMEMEKITEYEAQCSFLADMLGRQNEIDDTLYDIYFTSEQNVMAAGSGYEPDGTVDFTQRSWYISAKETGEIHYESPYKDADSGRPVITLSKSVSVNGQVIGVLAEDIFIDRVVEIVNQCQVEGNSYAMLIDQNMGLMVHPNEAYGYVNDEPVALANLQGQPYGELMKALTGRGSGGVIWVKDYDGVIRGIFVSEVSGGWHMAVAVERAVLYRDTLSLVNGFIVAAVISLILGMVVIVPIINEILKKLLEVLSASEEAVFHINNSSQQLGDVTASMVSGARQINLRMQNVSSIMDEQYSRVNDGRDKLTQLDQQISIFEKQFAQMQDATVAVNEKIGENMSVVENLRTRTHSSMESISGLLEEVEALETKSRDITDIISTINGISQQTNILALNASVEAARAGEAGRGFAVVAEEIRILSNKIQESVGSISNLITEIQSEIQNTSTQIQSYGKDFESNAEIVSKVQKTFTGMEDNIKTLGDISTGLSREMYQFEDAMKAMNTSFQMIEHNTDICVKDTRDTLAASKNQEAISRYLEQFSASLKSDAKDLHNKTDRFKHI